MLIFSIVFSETSLFRTNTMPKFYVSSGNLQLVIEADHVRAAAIWAVHRCLSQVTPFVSDDANTVDSHVVNDRHLGETIHVSERGFGSDDEKTLATLPVVAEWSRLLVALDRLQQQLSGDDKQAA